MGVYFIVQSKINCHLILRKAISNAKVNRINMAFGLPPPHI